MILAAGYQDLFAGKYTDLGFIAAHEVASAVALFILEHVRKPG